VVGGEDSDFHFEEVRCIVRVRSTQRVVETRREEGTRTWRAVSSHFFVGRARRATDFRELLRQSRMWPSHVQECAPITSFVRASRVGADDFAPVLISCPHASPSVRSVRRSAFPNSHIRDNGWSDDAIEPRSRPVATSRLLSTKARRARLFLNFRAGFIAESVWLLATVASRSSKEPPWNAIRARTEPTDPDKKSHVCSSNRNEPSFLGTQEFVRSARGKKVEG